MSGVGRRELRQRLSGVFTALVTPFRAGAIDVPAFERLIAAHLASGALVQALPGAVLEDPRIGWWFVTPRGAFSEPVQALHAWLAQTVAQSTGV